MNVEQLPFDQYQRYRLVADLLGTLRQKSKRLEVLDVGGRTALLRGFLPKDHVTLVDLEPSSERDLVLGDGAKLPFRDKSFDVVAAFDTLEHVPPKLRPAFVSECARVSRGYVVLAGPYHSERVAEAEKLLQTFLKDKLGVEHRYLEEHRHNGLPSRDKTEQQLRDLGAAVESLGHANLERWLALMCLSMYLDNDASLRGLAARMHEFYNRALYATDHAEPVYRHIVVASLGGGALPKVGALLDPPRAPSGALEPFTELTAELVAFDRERGAWREERARLDQVNRDLAQDLAGHSATLDEVEAALELERAETGRLKDQLESEHAQAEQALAELGADLAGHRRTLEQLEADAQAMRAEQAALERLLADERAAAAGSIETLESDLAGHKQRIAALLEEARTQLAEFERERAEVREIVDALERDLGGHRESLAHVEAELAAREAHIAELLRGAEHERREAAASIAELQQELSAHVELQSQLTREVELSRSEAARLLELLSHERAEAARVIAALQTELGLHQERGSALEAELAREQAASRESARALGADLAEHQRVLAALRLEQSALRAELDVLRAAREQDNQAAQRAHAVLQAEIVAHQGVQAELQADLDRHRAVLAEVNTELANTQATAQAIQKELIASNESGQGLGRSLAAREQEIAELRALLRSRAKNFKRAFSIKKPAF